MAITLVIGTLFLLLILFSVQDAKNTVKGICPNCNTKIGLRKGKVSCPNCGEPLRKEGDQFIPVEQGFCSGLVYIQHEYGQTEKAPTGANCLAGTMLFLW